MEPKQRRRFRGVFFATIKHHPMKVRPAPWQLSVTLYFLNPILKPVVSFLKFAARFFPGTAS